MIDTNRRFDIRCGDPSHGLLFGLTYDAACEHGRHLGPHGQDTKLIASYAWTPGTPDYGNALQATAERGTS